MSTETCLSSDCMRFPSRNQSRSVAHRRRCSLSRFGPLVRVPTHPLLVSQYLGPGSSRVTSPEPGRPLPRPARSGGQETNHIYTPRVSLTLSQCIYYALTPSRSNGAIYHASITVINRRLRRITRGCSPRSSRPGRGGVGGGKLSGCPLDGPVSSSSHSCVRRRTAESTGMDMAPRQHQSKAAGAHVQRFRERPRLSSIP